MAGRPKLPLQVQADIETAREWAIRNALPLCTLLFVEETVFPLSPIRRAEPKPANLKLELRGYASALFDAEAGFYPEQAKDRTELRTWLTDLASCIQAEVIEAMQPFSVLHNFHCPAREREEAIADVLRDRIQHWMRVNENRWVLNVMSGKFGPAMPTSPEQPTETTEQNPTGKSGPGISERLDEAATLQDISHEEQADRIGISRTTYFEVKAGRGGRKSRRTVEAYLSRTLPSPD